jgi:hypothetical protein
LGLAFAAVVTIRYRASVCSASDGAGRAAMGETSPVTGGAPPNENLTGGSVVASSP